MRNKKLGIKAFTLVELLLMITILGILAAIAIPRLFPQSEKARVAEAINILSAIRQGEEAYFLAKGTYKGCGSATSFTGAAIDACYETLGMQNPNLGRYFNYYVTGVGIFDAFAIRNATQDPNSTYRTKTIQIDETGTWCGTHPLKPTNADGTLC